MSPIKRIVYFATGVLFILFAYQGSLFPDLPSEARTTFLLITIGMGIISVRMTMAAHSSIMLAERTASPEQRALIEVELAASEPLIRRLSVWGRALLGLGSGVFLFELAFGFANRSIYPDLTLPASLTLMTVGAMSTVLAAMIKHRFIRFPTKKN